MDFRKFRK